MAVDDEEDGTWKKDDTWKKMISRFDYVHFLANSFRVWKLHCNKGTIQINLPK